MGTPIPPTHPPQTSYVYVPSEKIPSRCEECDGDGDDEAETAFAQKAFFGDEDDDDKEGPFFGGQR